MPGSGFVLMVLMMFFPYQVLETVGLSDSHPDILALIAVLIPGIGVRAGGSMRWLRIQSFTFQPSEFAKLGLVIFLGLFSDQEGGKDSELLLWISSHAPHFRSRHCPGAEGTRFRSRLLSDGHGFSSPLPRRSKSDLYRRRLPAGRSGRLLFSDECSLPLQETAEFHPALG